MSAKHKNTLPAHSGLRAICAGPVSAWTSRIQAPQLSRNAFNAINIIDQEYFECNKACTVIQLAAHMPVDTGRLPLHRSAQCVREGCLQADGGMHWSLSPCDGLLILQSVEHLLLLV